MLLALKFFVGFFTFGAFMCLLTVVLLIFPNTPLSSLWRLNPDAHTVFHAIGNWAVLLMLAVGTACAAAAIGLVKQLEWGRILAIAILAVNLLGDLANVFLRHDYRALIGLPIAAIFVACLMSRQMRTIFREA
ncbi:MAG: hypothetical protein ACXWHF_04385 [Chthoniobacterales bacterium]